MTRGDLIDVAFKDASVNYKSIYQSGHWLPLVLKVKLPEAMVCSVFAQVYGECSVSWAEPGGGLFSRRQGVKFKGTEIHLSQKVVVHDSEEPHPAGPRVYPINVSLPSNLPSSFIGNHGFIRYFVLAAVEKQSRVLHRRRRPFSVVATADCANIPGAVAGPFALNEAVPVKCGHFCCGTCFGSIHLRVQLPKRGFALGEALDVFGEIQNESSADLEDVRLQISQRVTYTMNGRSKQINQTAASVELPRVKRGDLMPLMHSLPIARHQPTHCADCKHIELHYFFQIVACAGCGWLMKKQLCELFFGTSPMLPLRPAGQS